MIEKQPRNITMPNERLQTIINNILDVVVEIDLNGSFTYVSPQSLQMLGYEPKEVIGRKALRYVHPDDLESVMNAMRKAIDNNQHLSFEYRTRHKNGNYIHVSAKGGIINLNDESKIITVIRDISPKIIAEKKFRESEQHYRKIIESIGDPIQVMDNNLQIIMANSTFKAWINEYGIDSEILGKTPFELFPFLLKGIVDEYNHVFETGQTLITEESNILNGKTIYTETRKIPILTNGKVTQIVSVLRNITEKKKADQDLKESEEKYRNLFEESPYMIFLIDFNGKLLDMNQTALDTIAFRKEDLIGRNFGTIDIMRIKSLSSLTEMFKKVLKDGFLDPFEIYVDNPKLKLNWMKIQAKLVNIGEKKLIQVIIEDISDKKKAEKMLKDSEKKFQNIIENTTDAIVIIDLNGKLQYVSPQLSIILKGREVKETSRLFHNIHEDDVQEIITFFKKTIEEKSISDNALEFRILDNKNNYIWLASTFKNYYDDNGNIIGFITTLRDITEKKIAQQRLRDSEYHYRHLFENSPDAIVVTDIHGNVLDQNTAVERIFGIPRHKSIGEHFGNFGIFDSEQISLIKTRVKKMFNGIIIKPISLKVKDKFGNNLWILHQSSIINIGDEKIIESIVQDITERKKAEEIIKTENKRLLELNKMKTDLITRVSHELKTPLNSVYGGAQILLSLYRDKTCSEALEFIQMIHKGGERLKILIENILDISRVESDQLKLKLSRENLSEIIRECIEEIKYLVNLRSIYVQLDLPVEIYLNVDKIRIGQVITNLLSNAIKNTPSKGLVKVTLKEVNDNIYLSIADTGVGLIESDMDKLFKQFGKIERYGQNLDVDIEGSGLGLFISKQIIDLHGGTIWEESKGRNQGSTFKIKLLKDID